MVELSIGTIEHYETVYLLPILVLFLLFTNEIARMDPGAVVKSLAKLCLEFKIDFNLRGKYLAHHLESRHFQSHLRYATFDILCKHVHERPERLRDI